MAARETSNTHTHIKRNKIKTNKYTATVYRTPGKSTLLLSSVCTCHFHLLYQSSSQDWLVLSLCLDKQKTKDHQVLITFKLCYYVDLRTNCGVAMKAGSKLQQQHNYMYSECMRSYKFTQYTYLFIICEKVQTVEWMTIECIKLVI